MLRTIRQDEDRTDGKRDHHGGDDRYRDVFALETDYCHGKSESAVTVMVCCSPHHPTGGLCSLRCILTAQFRPGPDSPQCDSGVYVD
jgi:bifunctional pyridoxal-dependent enzyme with beta-cystathionase and maltose regulon repressor activities